MKVQMTISLTGTLDGRRYPPKGGEFDVPDVVGANLCAKGYAEPVAKTESSRAEKRPAAKRAEKRA